MAKKKKMAMNANSEGERDPQEQKNLEGAFAEALEDVQSTQEMTGTKSWKKQFSKHRTELSVCAKRVKEFVEAHDITDMDSIKNLMKRFKELSVLSDNFNRLVDPVIIDVRCINEFSSTYRLYADLFDHEASFDMDTGKLTINKVKA